MPARRDLPPRSPAKILPQLAIPDGYYLEETDVEVPDVSPERGYWLRWRAQARVHELNARREVPSYRYEVVDTGKRFGRRYLPTPYQNTLVPIPPLRVVRDDG